MRGRIAVDVEINGRIGFVLPFGAPHSKETSSASGVANLFTAQLSAPPFWQTSSVEHTVAITLHFALFRLLSL